MMDNNDDSSYLLSTYISQLFKTQKQSRDYHPSFTDDEMNLQRLSNFHGVTQLLNGNAWIES